MSVGDENERDRKHELRSDGQYNPAMRELWFKFGIDITNSAKVEDVNRGLVWLLSITTPAKLEETLRAMAWLTSITTPSRFEETTKALAWAVAAEKRAATFGTRLLSWLSIGVGITVGLFSILKYLQDWRGH